jgi:hypothetical protein
VTEANDDVARGMCVAQGQEGFSSTIEITTHDVKVLKVSTESFCLS